MAGPGLVPTEGGLLGGVEEGEGDGHVDDDGEDVADGGDEGVAHEGGVETKTFEDEGEDAASDGPAGDDEEEGDGDDEGPEEMFMRLLFAQGLNPGEDEAENGEEAAEHEADEEFSPEDFAPVAEGDVARGHGGDDEGGGLIAGVAAAAHDERDENDQPGPFGELGFVGAQGGGGEHGGGEEDGKPDATLPPERDDAGLHVALFQGRYGGCELGIFGGLFAKGVDDVVVRDDADKAALVIDDGNRVQVVFRDAASDDVAVFRRVHIDQVGLHQVRDFEIGLFQRGEELAGGDDAVEVLIGIDGVDVVDRFEVLGLAGHLVDRLADGKRLGDHGDFGRHHRAGGIFGIIAEAEDFAALVRGEEWEDFLDDLRMDIAKKIDAVVSRQIGQELGDLGPVLQMNDLELLVAVEKSEDVFAELEIGMPQDSPGIGSVEAFHELGGAGRVESRAEFLELEGVVLRQHLAQLG